MKATYIDTFLESGTEFAYNLSEIVLTKLGEGVIMRIGGKPDDAGEDF